MNTILPRFLVVFRNGCWQIFDRISWETVDRISLEADARRICSEANTRLSGKKSS